MRQGNMVEETTTAIASAGAGAVTLTALANKPRFSTYFGTQNTDCRYIIEDTTTGEYEIGLGRVSSNVLTRALPQETWTGSVLNILNPSALTFSAGATPTTSNIRIRMGAVTADKGTGMVARQSTIAGDSNWRDYPLTAGVSWSSNGQTVTLTADREHYAPYNLLVGGVLGGIQFEVTTAVAASNWKWALYGHGSDGLPGVKIVDFVTTSTATTGIKTDTATASWTPAGKVKLDPGVVWIGYIPSHAITFRTTQTGMISFANPLGRKDGYGWGPQCYVAGSYSTGLPAIPSLGSATMDSSAGIGTPWIGLKVVS